MRKPSRVLYLDSVIVNRQSCGCPAIFIISMCQAVYNGFTQSDNRYLKLFFPSQSLNFPTQVEVLEAECDGSIKNVKEIAAYLLVVDKLILVDAGKSGKPDFSTGCSNAFLVRTIRLRRYSVCRSLSA